jgi:glyceraldehyde 3-phosphate dehydrogenase
MSSDRKTRIGIMGFGQVGRQLYHLAAASDDLEITAISDIGKPDILHYLLQSEDAKDCTLKGNYLENPAFRTRMLQNDVPGETPWDVFGVDVVIDATGKFRTAASLQAHIDNGAPRVIITTLPESPLDRMVVPGVNQASISAGDQIISTGSATTAAFALTLKILDEALGVENATMTTIHAYSSDQALQDYAGKDPRRSRSAAENIIPNISSSPHWVEALLPKFAGKLSGHALNVPVQRGSLLDLSMVMSSPGVSAEDVNNAMLAACDNYPGIVSCVVDPIVSSDVIGNSHSAVFDLKGTLKSGKRMVKSLVWYESLGHALRTLDVVRLYRELDSKENAQ